MNASAVISGADSSFYLSVNGAWIHIGAALGCDGKGIHCCVEGMEKTMMKGLDAFWNKFGVLTGFVGSGWSKNDGLEKENQAEDRCRGVFGGGTEGGITAGGKFKDSKEREVTILDGTFGLGGQLVVQRITERWWEELALWRGEPLKSFQPSVMVSD